MKQRTLTMLGVVLVSGVLIISASYGDLVGEAQRLLEKLPDGLDPLGARAAPAPGSSKEVTELEKKQTEVEERQFAAKWDALTALCDAFGRGGDLWKMNGYLGS